MRHALIVLGLLILGSCETQNEKLPESYDLILLNARIVDVASGQVKPPSLVGIIGDTIRIVTEMANAAGLNATRMLDLEGQYIMPGLWDNHVHFRGGDSLIRENRNLLPLFLAHGITTVRDAGGDMTPAVLSWQKEIRAGTLAGPDIFTSGPKFDGPEPAWAGSIAVTESSQVTKGLDSLEALGVDYIKIYDGSISREMYYEIIRQAENRNLPVTGHMPMDANMLEAIAMGLDGSEHLYYALNIASPAGDSLRAADPGFGMLGGLVNAYDSTYAADVFAKMGESEFSVTPTLFIMGIINRLASEDHSTDSLLRYIGPGIRETYNRRINSAVRRSEASQALHDKLLETFQAMLAAMQAQGIRIVAGSDCGPYNSYVYPGASLIGELEAMVLNGGLTPREALAASVINGPAFLGLSDYYGAVEIGKVGDIIVLAGNPLEDIRNIRTLSLVIDGNNIIAARRLLK